MIAGLLLAAAVLIRPNPALTPGVVRTDLTLHAICATRWGKDKRHVTARMKRDTYAAYGVTQSGHWLISMKGTRYWQSDNEVDHLVSRELGGADDVRNLWIQPYTGEWNAYQKDRLENNLHMRVCAGALTLDVAQAAIRTDWILAYQTYINARPDWLP